MTARTRVTIRGFKGCCLGESQKRIMSTRQDPFPGPRRLVSSRSVMIKRRYSRGVSEGVHVG